MPQCDVRCKVQIMKKEWCNICIWRNMFQLTMIIVSTVVFFGCLVVCVWSISNPGSWSQVVVFSAAAVVGSTAHFTIAEESVRVAGKYGLMLAFASLLVPTFLNSQATRLTVCQLETPFPSISWPKPQFQTSTMRFSICLPIVPSGRPVCQQSIRTTRSITRGMSWVR